MAALLEREQVVAHARRRGEGTVPAFAPVDELGERVVERHEAELQPGLVRLETRQRTGQVDDRRVAPTAVEEAQRTLDVGRAKRMPAAAEPDERLLRRGERAQLLLGELDVPDRDAPVELRQGFLREQPARAAG